MSKRDRKKRNKHHQKKGSSQFNSKKTIHGSRINKSKKQNKINQKVINEYAINAEQHSILVLGDGDFSYSIGMMEQNDVAKLKHKMVCTSYESRQQVEDKYPTASSNIKRLLANGIKVLFNIDATKLNSFEVLKDGWFDRIVFNFPHTGNQRVHENQNLLKQFFANCLQKLKMPFGQVHVTLKICPPYSSWDVESQAKLSNFLLVNVSNMDSNGVYRHVTTEKHAKSVGNLKKYSKTFVFQYLQQV